jgi:hypothetical protein
MVIDITVSSEEFNDEFIVFEFDNGGLSTDNFLAEVLWSSNGLVVAVDIVNGLETNNVVGGMDNNELLNLVRGTWVLGEERAIIEKDGIRMTLSVEIVFRTAPHI